MDYSKGDLILISYKKQKALGVFLFPFNEDIIVYAPWESSFITDRIKQGVYRYRKTHLNKVEKISINELLKHDKSLIKGVWREKQISNWLEEYTLARLLTATNPLLRLMAQKQLKDHGI